MTRQPEDFRDVRKERIKRRLPGIVGLISNHCKGRDQIRGSEPENGSADKASLIVDLAAVNVLQLQATD
jgi:hypothetical protein